MSVVDKIRAWLDTGKSDHMLTDDTLITSELILLVRVIYADGVMEPEEIRRFKEICESAFGIPEEDLPKIFIYIKDIGFEISLSDVARNFRDEDKERKLTLLDHMYEIASSDGEVSSEELEIIRRTAAVVGVNANTVISKAA